MVHDRVTSDANSPPRRRIGIILSTGILCCVIIVAVVLIRLWMFAHSPTNNNPTDPIVVSIPADSGFNSIQKKLQETGVIREGILFRLLADILGVTQRLKAGEYHFSPSQTPFQILGQLERGEVILWPLTIPEGLTLAQIANILERDGWVDKKIFLNKLKNPALLAGLGLKSNSSEGYLFPDTYHLTKTQDENAIIRLMTNRMVMVLADLYGLPADRTSNFTNFPTINRRGVDLTLHEVLTLASIVEKETGLNTERHLVAAVFLNRLRRGMRLQTDPTVIYGLPSFAGNLTRKNLRTPTPYNTYRIKGLPPGPIAAPGRAAIEAVLLTKEQFQNKFPGQDWQALNHFLYFVSKNDGSHAFAKTLREHNRAVAKFQKGK